MASGTAVVASRTQALVEVAGDAALLANPYDTTDMSKKIESVMNDAYVRATLIRNGEKRVSNFSWGKTAQETIAVYQKVFQEERIVARRKAAL
jgi:glycosyltransferase involved in cell wall biosynthesis